MGLNKCNAGSNTRRLKEARPKAARKARIGNDSKQIDGNKQSKVRKPERVPQDSRPGFSTGLLPGSCLDFSDPGYRSLVYPELFMGQIRILSDQVANQIAAGEVVDRPASVVKGASGESLDAGASRIRVEIEGGGRRLIRVVDDGHGMNRDDALLAFERHATSKLHSADDLLSIATLGFRGEALPSIASVARVILATSTAQEAAGTRIEIAEAEKIRHVEDAPLPLGTTIDASAICSSTLLRAANFFAPNLPSWRM